MLSPPPPLSHPTVAPCRDLSSICFWLEFEQGKETPPALGWVGKNLQGCCCIWSGSRRGDTRLGLSSFPHSRCEKTKPNQFDSSNVGKVPKKASVSFLYRAWEGIHTPWDLHFHGVVHIPCDPASSLRFGSHLHDEDKETFAFLEWQWLLRNPRDGTGKAKQELSTFLCSLCPVQRSETRASLWNPQHQGFAIFPVHIPVPE